MKKLYAISMIKNHGTVRPPACASLLFVRLMSKGIAKQLCTHQARITQPRLSLKAGSNLAISNVMDCQVSFKDANHEIDVGHGLNMNGVEDEQRL